MLTNILQPTHLVTVLAVAILVGPKRLPFAGRALGQGLKEFKNAITASPDADLEVEQDTSPDRDGR